MKRLITICAVIGMMLAVSTAANATTVSWGTAGSGASVTVGASDVMLHTDDGGPGSAYVRLTIDGGIALNAISSLTYDAQLTAFAGSTSYPGTTPILEVVLNIDADSDNTLEGTGLAWMHSGWQASELGYIDSGNRGDNFLSGDFWPFVNSVDGSYVTRDALGSNYYYWSADDERDGLSLTLWSNFTALSLPAHDIDLTDKVYSIDFICGTSSNWIGTDIYVSSVALNGTSYAVPEPATIALLGLGALSLLRSSRRRREP